MISTILSFISGCILFCFADGGISNGVRDISTAEPKIIDAISWQGRDPSTSSPRILTLHINDITDPVIQAQTFCAKHADYLEIPCNEIRQLTEFIFYNYQTFELGHMESMGGFDIDIMHVAEDILRATSVSRFAMNRISDPSFQARMFCNKHNISVGDCGPVEKKAEDEFRTQARQRGVFNLPSDTLIGNLSLTLTGADGLPRNVPFSLHDNIPTYLNMRLFCIQHLIDWALCDHLNTMAENAYFDIKGNLPVGKLLTSIPLSVVNSEHETKAVVFNIFDHVRIPVQVKRFCTSENLSPSWCSQLLQAVAGQVDIPPIRHLYLGTCRYNTLFKRNRAHGFDVFPTRMLDNTRTFIYMLENMRLFSLDFFGIDPIISVDAFTELMFYDSNDVAFYRDFWEFVLYPPDYHALENVIVEIASRKVYYWKFNNSLIPVSSMAVGQLGSDSLISKYNLTYHELTDDEISADLDVLKNLVSVVFSPLVQLKVILHMDLKLIETNDNIPKRHKLGQLLEKLCSEKNISVFNPGRVTESNCQNIPSELFQNSECEYLEYWMMDGFHWSKRHDELNMNLTEWLGLSDHGTSHLYEQ